MDWQYFPELFKAMFAGTHGVLVTISTYLSFVPLLLYVWPRLRGKEMKAKLKKSRRCLGVAFVVLLFIGVIIASARVYTKKEVRFATPIELVSSVLQNKVFRVVDLAMLDSVVRGRIFEDCHIYGPAVVVGRRCDVRGGSLEGDLEGSFIETSNKRIRGVVWFEDCVFRDCTFHDNIAFMDTPDGIKHIKSQLRLVPALTIRGPADVNAALSAALATHEERLNREYPLGFAVLASAGEKRIVLPRVTRFEVDWDNVIVQRNQNNTVSIGFTYLREKEHNVTIKDLGMGMPAIPGLKSQLWQFWKVAIYGECLHADAAGLVVALGFQESSSLQK